MSFELDPLYIFYFFAAISAILFGEGMYLLFFSTGSYRNKINRRLAMLHEQPNREGILVQLRRERGLTAGGDFRLPLIAFNKLVLQSGMTLGITKFLIVVVGVAAAAATVVYIWYGSVLYTVLAALFFTTLGPLLFLKIKRGRRQKQFGARFPDAIDIIVRSLRAGHPVPVAITMVGRELPDPIGTEFGIAADEVTYGADLETAMRNLYFRVGQDDLPLFVTAVAIQGSTGGNLSEILQNLSSVIRMRFKMRRKIRALAAEGRASALILSSLPIGMFAVIQIVAPDFYSSVWHESLTKIILTAAGCWMGIGNLIMWRLVNFKI